jgi:hypothetical protein
VLRNFTKVKTLTQMDTDIKTAEAKYQMDKSTHELDLQKLSEIQQQIDFCTIQAPSSGQIVHASIRDDDPEDSFIIEEGALIRERQIIARLPDPSKMQVEVRVKESRISQVDVGMPATITIDAIPGREFQGRVTKVNGFPEPNRWFNGAKEYLVAVELDQLDAGVRPGLTAQVSIHVERMRDVVQVPVQSVVQEGGRYYCLAAERGTLVAKEVEVGSSNGQFVVIQAGLGTNESVAVNPREWWDQITGTQVDSVAPVADGVDSRVLAVDRSPSASRDETANETRTAADERPSQERKATDTKDTTIAEAKPSEESATSSLTSSVSTGTVAAPSAVGGR